MKVSLFTVKDSEINFLAKLKDYLQSKIHNLDVSAATLDSLLDLPSKISSAKSDLVFVSYYYSADSASLAAALGKLVDLELSSKKRILKDVRKIVPDDFDETEDELVVQHGKRIVKELVGKEPL